MTNVTVILKHVFKLVCLLMLGAFRVRYAVIPPTPPNKLQALGARSRFRVQQDEQDEWLTEHGLSSRRMRMTAREGFA